MENLKLYNNKKFISNDFFKDMEIKPESNDAKLMLAIAEESPEMYRKFLEGKKNTTP